MLVWGIPVGLNGKMTFLIFKFNQNGTGPRARSSHGITIVGEKAYVFGGEFTPRVRVDNNVFDLYTMTWSIAAATDNVPPSRVGVTMATIGMAHIRSLMSFYSFDSCTNEWTLVSNYDNGPAHRSYDSMTADDRNVYVFGGFGVSGWLNDLWGYDVGYKKWIKYPTPGDHWKGKCGSRKNIWVVYGFSGVEMDDVKRQAS
ncbi:hypothetical protein DITRI_Ditri13aG0133700 [Diplodiscus trichospermus]